MSDKNPEKRPEQSFNGEQETEQTEQGFSRPETEDSVEFEVVMHWGEFLSSPDFSYNYEQRLRFFQQQIGKGELEIDLKKLKIEKS